MALIDELRARRKLCEISVGIIENSDDSECKEDALRHYNAQLAEIDRRIAAEEHRTVVHLKPAYLKIKGD